MNFLGILNLTPDSFSDGGLWSDPRAAVAHGLDLLSQGAWGLDLGAESTRPGAAPLDSEAEWDRLRPVLIRLRQEAPHARLSVDTRHALVAERALDAGADMLNDVTGFRDPALRVLALRAPGGVIAMRSRQDADGTFVMPPYGNPGNASPAAMVDELAAIRDRLLAQGLPPERIWLDPGFGFGTTFREDRAFWEALPSLPEKLRWPQAQICIGISRKRFTAWMLGEPDRPPLARDGITATLQAQAQTWGYTCFRTHTLLRLP